MNATVKLIAATVGGVATALTIFGVGYGVGDNSADQLVQILQADKQRLAEDLERTREELEVLKQQSAAASAERAQTTASQPSNGVTTEATTGNVPSPSTATEEVTVSEGTSKVASTGGIRVSLVDLEFQGEPRRYQAIVTLSLPGKKPTVFSNLDVGATMSYESVDVQLTKIDSSEATFSIAHARQ